MVGQPVQFRLHQRDQFIERSFVSAAPVAQELGDLLLRGRGHRHKGCSTLQIVTWLRDFYSTDSLSIRKLRNSWRVPGGNSALEGRSTFMPARKNRRAGQMSQPKKGTT